MLLTDLKLLLKKYEQCLHLIGGQAVTQLENPYGFDKNMKNLICKRNQLHKSWKMDRQNNQN